jgi:hypothetical protein
MLFASIRVGLLLATLAASLHLAAAPRFWTLTGVQLEDGAIATGYFSYDDATATLANWNLHFSAGRFPPHTHVPGNSVPNPGLYIYSLSSDPRGLWRSLRIVPLTPLDGSRATVTIDASRSSDYFEDYYYTGESRRIIAGSLVLMTVPPPVTIVQVDEFYHQGLNHYFITASEGEKQLLDNGNHPGWVRTGESFKAHAAGSNASGSINPVCRYYGNPLRGLDSHFYSAQVGECFAVLWSFRQDWLLESDNVFQIHLPDTATGACPAGTIPVYRLWNRRVDSNHRYTTSVAIRDAMLAVGYVLEGYAGGAVMCAVL